MSKIEEMMSATSLSAVTGVNPEAVIDVEDVAEVPTETETETPSDEMFQFIAPKPENFEEMQKPPTGKISAPSQREAYVAFLIDSQNMSLVEANAAADKVFPPVEDANGNIAPSQTPVRNDGVGTTEMVVVNIDKSQLNDVTFTEEEKSKLVTAKAIKLNVLEDESLKSVKVKSSITGGKKKFAFLESFSGKLNQYSVPMMNTGDWATFKAAKAYEIGNAILPVDSMSGEMQSVHDWYSKQASFLYDKFVTSSGFPELEEGERPTYEQFINHFKFDDMNAGIFAISLSSVNAEETDTYKCNDCGHQFTETYATESLFNTEYRSQSMKDNLQKIRDNKFNREIILSYVEAKNEVIRIKSEDTGILYDLYLPTIAEGIEASRSFQSIATQDQYVQMNEFISMHILRIFVPEDDEYVLIGRDEEYENSHEYPYNRDEYDPASDVLAFLELMSQADYELVSAYLNAMVSFFDQLRTVTCPKCGKERIYTTELSSKVFTAARGERTLRDINPGGLLSL